MKTQNKDTVISLPSQLKTPSFVLNYPFSLSTKDPNNIWMKELNEKERKVDLEAAHAEFMDFYNYLSSYCLVYLLPSGKGMQFQDLVYVANIGCMLPHLKEQDTVVISNFKSKPRQGEEEIGKRFFEEMGYKTYKPQFYFEGEAELKYIRDNIYIGGYGLRSDIRAYKELSEKFGMKIITLPLTDEYLYHLDTVLFPINNETILLGTDFLSKKDIQLIEKFVEIIPISKNDCYGGSTNSVRAGKVILNADTTELAGMTTREKNVEIMRIERLTKICADQGLELALFELEEYAKSGALLSCMTFHLNYVDYQNE